MQSLSKIKTFHRMTFLKKFDKITTELCFSRSLFSIAHRSNRESSNCEGKGIRLISVICLLHVQGYCWPAAKLCASNTYVRSVLRSVRYWRGCWVLYYLSFTAPASPGFTGKCLRQRIKGWSFVGHQHLSTIFQHICQPRVHWPYGGCFTDWNRKTILLRETPFQS